MNLPTIGNPVEFRVGTSDEYKQLLSTSNYDPDTLYFLMDTLQIFLGGEDFSKSTFYYAGHVASTNDLPSITGDENHEGKVYTVGAQHRIYRSNSSQWEELSSADSSLDATSTNAIQNKVVTEELNKKLPKSGGQMTGSLDMNSQSIINLPSPTNDNDAASKSYVDQKVKNTIDEEIVVDSALSQTSTNPIQNKAVADKFEEVDEALEDKITKGTDINMNNRSITNVTMVNDRTSVATKGYVDDCVPKVDDSLNEESTNSIQNKVVSAALSQRYVKGDIPTPVNPNDAVNKEYVDNLSIQSGGIVVDDSLNEESTNPVQNKVIYAKIKSIEETLDGIDISGGSGGQESVEIDTEMSDESENPVQNRVIKSYIDDQVSDLSQDIEGCLKPEDVDSEIDELSTNPVQNKVIAQALKNMSPGTEITIDSTIDETSENPVQNKVIAQALSELESKIPGETPAVTITVDSELSDTSENPVQNKVLTDKIRSIEDQLAESGSTVIINPFAGSDDLTYQIDNGTCICTGRKAGASGPSIVVPYFYESGGVSYPVREIAKDSFQNLTDVTTFVVGDSVRVIGSGVLKGCTNVNYIRLGRSVRSIGTEYKEKWDSIPVGESHTFEDTACYKDTSNWERGLLYIDDCLIRADPKVVKGNLVVRPGTTAIACQALRACTNLTSVTIPEGVTILGDRTIFKLGTGETDILDKGLDYIVIPSSADQAQPGFVGLTNVDTVYYGGSKDDWESLVDIMTGVGVTLTDSTIYVNSTGPGSGELYTKS